MTETPEFHFDGWTLRTRSGELAREGNVQRLPQQPLRVLVELLSHPGEVVTRERLVEVLWPKGVVDFDNSLNAVIRKLRSTLGDDSETPRYIETLPGGRTHAILKLNGYYHPVDDTPDVVVPAGHLFVMGDNRDNSADSRIATAQGGVGLLPVADLIGRAEGIVASWDLKTKEQPIWTWPSGLRGARFFTAVH